MTTHKTQRLALFLDGTWNIEDDTTNVRKAYQLTKEGPSSCGQYIQKRYYDRGVGTGKFESITGGGLGFGLEINVREAYNWLIDNYNDGDEIYIFGFSRGAYTARSLLGFIAACGLVRRGAPITVTQLWEGYAFISKNRENLNSKWWKRVFKKHKYYFRRIHLLKDSWREEAIDKLKEPETDELKEPETETEELLIKWSRRVRITYMGIYDTVGAMGVKATGVPGFNSKLDAAHNLYPSRLIQKCRHALAIDEHRSSFRLTPILDFIKHEEKEKEKINSYNGFIEQRWFIGTHSNIGGGYPNNTLSLYPFKWVLEGAKNAEGGAKGLEMHKINELLHQKDSIPDYIKIRDSYSEFFFKLWQGIIREKRIYREIGRDEVIQTDHTLYPVEEKIDESVYALIKSQKNKEELEPYAPPNLLAYARKSLDPKLMHLILDKKTYQQWLGGAINYKKATDSTLWKSLTRWLLPRFFLILWSVLAAFGIEYISQLFTISPSFGSLTISVLAAFFVLIDWGEYKSTLKIALYPKAVFPRVRWNVLYWFRIIGVLAFVAGVIDFFFGIHGFMQYLYALLSAFFMLMILNSSKPFFFDNNETVTENDKQFSSLSPVEYNVKDKDKEELGNIKKEINQKLIKIASILFFFILLLCPVCCSNPKTCIKEGSPEDLASNLLLLQLFLITSYAVYKWSYRPVSKSQSNLGSVFPLQFIWRKERTEKLLGTWSEKFMRAWIKPSEQTKKSWFRLREILQELIWRNLLGILPYYISVLSLFFYISSKHLGKNKLINFILTPDVLLGLPLWVVIILSTALVDILAGFLQLKIIADYSNKKTNTFLVIASAVFTTIKTVSFYGLVLLSFFIFFLLHKNSIKFNELRYFSANIIVYVFMAYKLGEYFYRSTKRIFELKKLKEDFSKQKNKNSDQQV